MTSTLLIIQFVLAVLLTIVILLQKSASMGLGAYSGSNESMFGAKGPASFLTKITFALGTILVANTLYLGYLYNQENSKSIVDSVEINQLIPEAPQNTIPAPAAPTAPSTVPELPPVVPSAPSNN